jgi:hypothetical protein
MPRPPISAQHVLDYLRLEDVEDLVPGSVKYVGVDDSGPAESHYWSYPGSCSVQWACLDQTGLSFAETVPEHIRRATRAYTDHPKRAKPPAPRNPWTGRNLREEDLPLWVPSTKVRSIDAAFTASFLYDFEKAAAIFGAKPSMDKYGGGAGPCAFFVLELARNRLAMLEYCQAYKQVHLHLPTRGLSGVCYWEDYFQVVDPLGLELKDVFRQGGTIWKHRRPTPGKLARTQNHERTMWIPR